MSLRKELINQRGGSFGSSGTSTATNPLGANNNEAKNDRLRLRWLGGAVAELQSELAEVLKTRNASEELAERARLRSEIELLRADVTGVGRGLRDLGGRLAGLESTLSILRLDIAATKERTGQLSRTCADVSSQVGGLFDKYGSISFFVECGWRERVGVCGGESRGDLGVEW